MWRVPSLLILGALLASPTGAQETERSALPAAAANRPVDLLLPWLLQENARLRGIPFGELIFDAPGKKVFAVDLKSEIDQRVVKQVSAVLDEVVRRLNEPASVTQGIARINEVSSHFEDALRALLNAAPGMSCDFRRLPTGTCSVRVIRTCGWSIRNRSGCFISIRSSTRPGAGRAAFVRFISSRKIDEQSARQCRAPCRGI